MDLNLTTLTLVPDLLRGPSVCALQVVLNMLHSATLDPGLPQPEGPRVVRPKVNPYVIKKLRLAYLCIPHQAILPLKGYGGTESSCEAELEGLTKLQEDGARLLLFVPLQARSLQVEMAN
jgi:hypothetical protein